MATILDVAAQGGIIKYDPDLKVGEQEERLFYLFPKAVSRIEQKVAKLASAFGSEITPLEQLDALLATFCAGDVMSFGRQFHPLRHVDLGIWELKTADLRLFGWFSARDCFVCTNIDDATQIKRSQMYTGYRDEAVRLRATLPLSDPKFVPGDDPNDVVSNFC